MRRAVIPTFISMITLAAMQVVVLGELSNEHRAAVDYYIQKLGENPRRLSGFEDEAARDVVQRLAEAKEIQQRTLLIVTTANTLLNGLQLSQEVGDSAKAELYRQLGDSSPLVRNYAAYAVVWVDQRAALDRIAPLLKDSDRGVRMAVADNFGAVGGLENIKTLEVALMERSANMSKADIEKDASFAAGYKAIEAIKEHAGDPNFKIKRGPHFLDRDDVEQAVVKKEPDAVQNREENKTSAVEVTNSNPMGAGMKDSNEPRSEQKAPSYEIVWWLLFGLIGGGALRFLWRRKNKRA